MSGWQVGDLAVKRRGPCTKMPRGTVARVLKVTGLVEDSITGLLNQGLVLEGWPTRDEFVGWSSMNFDKIKPDTECANEDDAAWLKDLLANPKVQVQP